jgi:hypothetical protein
VPDAVEHIVVIGKMLARFRVAVANARRERFRPREIGGALVKLLWRLRYAWRRHGPIGFVRLVAHNLSHYFHNRGKDAVATARADTFDEKYGTDTSGIREIGSLDVIASVGAQSAVRYEPSVGQEVRAALERLEIDYPEYSFVDFGSGKGRVVLVASGFPFKEVIGVEFSRELHEIASHNVARLPPEVVRAGTVRTVHGDAATFHPPKSDLVCYLYNPFGPPVLSKVVWRLISHREDHGYRVIVIYVDPRHRGAFEETGKFVVLDESPQVLILTTTPRAPAGSDDRL